MKIIIKYPLWEFKNNWILIYIAANRNKKTDLSSKKPSNTKLGKIREKGEPTKDIVKMLNSENRFVEHDDKMMAIKIPTQKITEKLEQCGNVTRTAETLIPLIVCRSKSCGLRLLSSGSCFQDDCGLHVFTLDFVFSD